MNRRITAAIVAALSVISCTEKSEENTGTRTEALDSSLWQESEWIAAADTPIVQGAIMGNNERAADGASWFVSDLTNPENVKKAVWMTTGLGVYRIFINGVEVGEEFLKPGFTHYEKTRFSFTYDITESFKKGAGDVNRLSAQATPGWWADKIITPAGHDGMNGSKPAFRGVLQITFADGSVQNFGTNCTDWKVGVAGPVTHAAIFDGEEYDARIPQGYLTPEKLGVPEKFDEFKGNIFPSDGAEVYLRRDLALKPQAAYVWKDVEDAGEKEYGKVVIAKEYAPGEEMIVEAGESLVLDFGQNTAGIPEFEFSAAEGTVLTFLPSEILNDGNGAVSRGMDGPEGSIHRENLRAHKIGIRLIYTFGADKGYVTYHPSSTFFGYRYASVSATAPVKIRSIVTLPVSSITKELETGTLTTGNALVNQLISNTVWGQRSNYLSIPTDCPQRNERLGWTADTQVFAETGSFFANTDRFFHKWTRDIRDTQTELGGYPGVAPYGQYGAAPTEMMRVGWADAGVIVPWVVWKQFGDNSIVDENWEAMERFMNHVNETKYDHAALAAENGNDQYADWLSYEALESHAPKFDKDASGKRTLKKDYDEYWDYLGASYWAIDAAMMRDMAKATGRDWKAYEAMATDAVAYLRENFLISDGSFRNAVFNTMQTPALFALKNGLVEGQAKENMTTRLRRNFEMHGMCLQTGFLGTSILMPTLSENGMDDIAWNLLFQRKNPSWLYSVDNGATTIWERWNSYTIESGMGPKGMNSFNHYAYGCVCEWLWKTAAGIAADTEAPGFRHIIMKPVPDRRLGFLKASYKSAAGLITSEWKYDGDIWKWHFSIPEGSTAIVFLPDGSAPKEYVSGSHSVKLTLGK